MCSVDSREPAGERKRGVGAWKLLTWTALRDAPIQLCSPPSFLQPRSLTQTSGDVGTPETCRNWRKPLHSCAQESRPCWSVSSLSLQLSCVHMKTASSVAVLSTPGEPGPSGKHPNFPLRSALATRNECLFAKG